MRRTVRALLLTTICVAVCPFAPLSAQSAPPAATPARPFPHPAAYAPGALRPSLPQARLDDDVRAFYDRWKSDFLRPAGTTADGRPLYRVAFGKKLAPSARTVSEGQGYGMVIVALMAGHDPDARRLFDGLHAFALAHPSARDSRLMTWEVPVGPGSDNAFDGDADIAHALLLAHAQWGDPAHADAARLRLAGLLASNIGPASRLPLLGDWVRPDGPVFNQDTIRSSDLMPAHFRAWARFTGDPAWTEVAQRSTALVAAFQAASAHDTGLLPDFIIHARTAPAAPRGKLLEAPTDGAYYYNAGRVPWRLGVDALLHRDPVSLRQSRLLSRWALRATGGDPLRLRAGYHLDGTPLKNSDYFTTFFAAPLAVAAMLDPDAQPWLDALYATIRDRHEDYYEDTVTLQCLLVLAGRYWHPPAPPPP